jgi:hypothetical protein
MKDIRNFPQKAQKGVLDLGMPRHTNKSSIVFTTSQFRFSPDLDSDGFVCSPNPDDDGLKLSLAILLSVTNYSHIKNQIRLPEPYHYYRKIIHFVKVQKWIVTITMCF